VSRRRVRRWVLPAIAGGTAVGIAAGAGYLGLVTGAVPVDLNLGRRVRPLGPQAIDIAAPRQLVFDIVAQPYLGRTTRAMSEKVRIIERGTGMCWPRTTPRFGARSRAGSPR